MFPFEDAIEEERNVWRLVDLSGAAAQDKTHLHPSAFPQSSPRARRVLFQPVFDNLL